ncbi:MAG TPA: carboxy terminal-processing peptidase [Bacteroidia bacterium]|jgi:carboxyl-terminal processing protease|nr:carboxy terminal-processing peptidase [Bacteroidia bacterium]
MKNSRIKMSLVTVSLALLSFSTVNYFFDKNQIILDIVMNGLYNAHYEPKKIDDNFSARFFDLYLKRVDYTKMFLMQPDVENMGKYKTKVDDQIQNETFELFELSNELITRRIEEKESWYKEILSKPFDYKTNEEYETDGQKTEFAKNETELRNKWRQYLQYHTVARLNELVDANEKIKSVKDTVAKARPFDSLEVEARGKVVKTMANYFKRLKKRTKKDRYGDYVNTIAAMYDPHTEFFAPKEKKKFDQSMSGQLEGIGARLQQKDEYIKVSEVMVAGPAYKEGELKAGDFIIKVAQGNDKAVDIVGMDIDDAIELIKGKKGTEVRLTVKKEDGSTKVIPIIRDIIEMDETFAHSAVIDNGKNKTGYIKLPTFYSDFTRTGAHHCAKDIRNEIEKLKNENITGIVLDLRDNGGGSLSEVVDMGGLFIKSGPIVQVGKHELQKDGTKQTKIDQLNDKNPDQIYDGPFVVLINRNSASASEIMAAAMQDYKRAVIIGTQSFGKGTVQSFLELDNYILPQFDTLKPLGSLKVTMQKFYRINGGATQLRGVMPDITLPDPYFYIDGGEKELDNPMPWDEIQKAQYVAYDIINYEKIKKASQERIKKSKEFGLIEMEAKSVKTKKDDTKYSLNLEKYAAEAKKFKEENKKYGDLNKDLRGFDATLMQVDVQRLSADTNKLNREKKWALNLKKDFYLQEATNVIGDMK